MSNNKLLDSAFNAFHKRDFKKAVESFDSLLEKEKFDSAMKARIEQYRATAQKKMDQSSASLDANSANVAFLINEGRFEEAEAMLKNGEFQADLVAYLKSQMSLLQDKVDEAKGFLEEAIKLNPDNKGYAINSSVFAPHLNESFQFLLD